MSTNQKHAEHARNALLQGIAAELADMAASTLEPSAGTLIDQATRDRLAADVYRALVSNLPPLVNVHHALDML